MTDTAVVFQTHLWSEAIARRFERLRREASPGFDVYLVVQDDEPQTLERWQSSLQSMGASDALFRFNAATLQESLGLRYFGLRQVMSNAHFPLLHFARSHPQAYAYYWLVEYDAELRGSWLDFFETYRASESAFIAAHFQNWTEWPDWVWWSSITLPPGKLPDAENLYKAFLPVARFSKQAIDEVHAAHEEGWLGHAEAVVPTVLLGNGHKLEDLNVRTRCYIGTYQDPAPLLTLQSTLRCRPPVDVNEFCNRGQGLMLFHPVKDPWYFDGKEVNVVTA